MWHALLEPRFGMSVGICIALSVFFGWLVAGPYKSTQPANPKKLQVEPLTSSANTAITVAGITVPIIGGVAAYSVLELHQSPSALSFLIAAIAITTLSIFAGLWTVFSLAAAGGDDGIISVHKDLNVCIPSYLVFQLALLISGTCLVILYVLTELKSSATEPNTAGFEGGPAIVRKPIAVGESAGDLSKAWGQPETQAAEGNDLLQHYSTEHSTIEVRIRDGKVVQITEKAL